MVNNEAAALSMSLSMLGDYNQANDTQAKRLRMASSSAPSTVDTQQQARAAVNVHMGAYLKPPTSSTITSSNNPSRGMSSHTGTVYYSSATDPTIVGGMASNSSPEDEYVSARLRKRLSLIVPFPRKPRDAEYSCSVCNTPYQCMVNENPWWAVYHHECPHCKAVQVPRIDISLASNAIEIDPNVGALYGDGIDDNSVAGDSEDDFESEEEDDEEEELSGNSNNLKSVVVQAVGDAAPVMTSINATSSSTATPIAPPTADENESLFDLTEAGEGGGLAVEEEEEKIFDGEGMLAQEDASKLLVLMSHARECLGYHSSPEHEEICRSTKFLMLHLRDCNGRNCGKECRFQWCSPCKKMLKHLTRCAVPSGCSVCSPWSLPEAYKQLRDHGLQRRQEAQHQLADDVLNHHHQQSAMIH